MGIIGVPRAFCHAIGATPVAKYFLPPRCRHAFGQVARAHPPPVVCGVQRVSPSSDITMWHYPSFVLERACNAPLQEQSWENAVSGAVANIPRLHFPSFVLEHAGTLWVETLLLCAETLWAETVWVDTLWADPHGPRPYGPIPYGPRPSGPRPYGPRLLSTRVTPRPRNDGGKMPSRVQSQTLRDGISPPLFPSTRVTPHPRNDGGKMPSRVQSPTLRDGKFPPLFLSARVTPHPRNDGGKMPSRAQSQT